MLLYLQIDNIQGNKGGALHAVVKAACLGSRRSRARPPLWHSGFKVTNVPSPLTRRYSVLWGASVTERWPAPPQTVRARISNPVSGEVWRAVSSHSSHHPQQVLMVSLDYMCTKVA